MSSSAFVFLSLFAVAAQAKKACLSWPWYNAPLDPVVFNTPNSLVSSIYDWETYRPPSQNDTAGLEFIGMQRCMDCGSSPLNQLYNRLTQQGWKTVYTLNEPDLNGIAARDAASWYIQNINPLPAKKALPAVSSSTAPGQGLSWISDMITACAGQCKFDYINVHWYGSSMEQFQTFIESAHAQFPNYPIVVSEYALGPPVQPSAMLAFFQQAIPFLESAAYVESHCPYVATSPALAEAQGQSSSWVSSCLFNNDGTPSPVGQLLLNGGPPASAVAQTNVTNNALTSGTPSAAQTSSTPGAAPASGTPSAAPTSGTPSAEPANGTPSAKPTGSTPSAAPTNGTPGAAPASGTPSAKPTSHTTSGKPTNTSGAPTSAKSSCAAKQAHRMRKRLSTH